MSHTSPVPRILLVDDDSDISMALSDYLCQEGFNVELAETGSRALEKGLSNHYDAVLLDIGLPDLDGIEVLNELASHKQELPIILLTAFTSLATSTPPDTLKKAFSYLTKPYNREEVRNVLGRAILTGRNQATEGNPQSAQPKGLSLSSFPSIIQPSHSPDSPRPDPGCQLTLGEYQRLTESIQLMQFAFDHVPEAILVADSQKRFRFANLAARESLGYTHEELKTLRIPDIAPYHDSQRYQKHLNELRQGKTLDYYTTHRTKQGQDISLQISVYLLVFQGQEFTCAITKSMASSSCSPQDSNYIAQPLS